MFIQEISIEIKNPDIDRAELINKMDDVLNAMTKNGQLQDVYTPMYFHENRLICLVIVQEKSSFARKNENIYAKQRRSEMEKMCRAKFQVKTLGKDEPTKENTRISGGRICRCKKPSSYILWTEYCTVHSPLICGDCGGYVPHYRIPKPPEYDDKGYSDPGRQDCFYINMWENAYQWCDNLSFAGFGERWGTRQLQEHDSGLSKDGREVCREIEKMVGVPVYYYLYNYRRLTDEQDKERKCPECGNDWLLDEPWHGLDFCCEKCRLVSNITYNLR